jgi:hypothetical protein
MLAGVPKAMPKLDFRQGRSCTENPLCRCAGRKKWLAPQGHKLALLQASGIGQHCLVREDSNDLENNKIRVSKAK